MRRTRASHSAAAEGLEQPLNRRSAPTAKSKSKAREQQDQGRLQKPACTPGSVNADWADARRAARYRVFRQIIGTDPDFVHVATVTDSDATVNSFTSGMTVKVRVTAANDAGESQPSAEVQIVVP